LLLTRDRLYRAEVGPRGVSLELRGKHSAGGTFAIRTIGATRGDTSLSLSTGPWRAHENSAVRTLAPGLRERVTAREGRLAWDFLLARAPAGSGSLTIDARVSSAGRLAERSLRFPAGAGRSVRVG